MPDNPLKPDILPLPAHTIEQQVNILQIENRMLREQLQLNQRLTDASIDCILAMDTGLNIIAWNNACALFFGLDPDDAIGKSYYEVFPEARENKAITTSLDNALKGMKSFLPAAHSVHTKGHFESHIIPVVDEAGKAEGILHVMHDVAHRVKAEEELAALNRELSHKYEELKRANAELSTFTHITSHDLKEPLRKIYIFIEMVLNKEAAKLSNEGRANMRRVQSSVQQLSLLADSLVSFSEIKQEPHKRISLNKALREAITLLKPRINDQQAVLHTTELPDVTGSEWQFRLLFQQLLSNAIKFQLPGSYPAINIGMQWPAPVDDNNEPFLCISVEDNGIGIAPEYHSKIFELFSRLHAKTEYPGVGMGLAFVKKIVEQHKGFIKVRPGQQGGTRFECYFPGFMLVENGTEL